MQSQKRIKTITEPKQHSQKKDKKQKQGRGHKTSQVHTKSASKEITPKKHSMIVQKSKYKGQSSSYKKMSKNNKQMTSICSYSVIEKQSMPATKRKCSNAHSMNKYQNLVKNRDKMSTSIKSTVNNFSILSKCLTQYIKEEKKAGKDPNKQILHLIKAFNRSQVAPLSKDLQKLINKMLNYIQDSVIFPQNAQIQDEVENQRIKSKSSFSEVSDKEVARSLIRDNIFVASTVKKKEKVSNNENKDEAFDYIKEYNNKINPDIKNSRYKGQQKVIEKELQRQLKNDINNMHNQLGSLRSAGQKLQKISDIKYEDRKKLEEIHSKNEKTLAELRKSNTCNLKKTNFKTEQDAESESQEDNEEGAH